MILTDVAGHLVSDHRLKELHDFAADLGLRREWFQGRRRIPHYDLTTQRKRFQVLAAGAVQVKRTELVRRAVKCWLPHPPDHREPDRGIMARLEYFYELCDGPLMGYYVKGHVDPDLFMDVVEWEDPDALDTWDGAVPHYAVGHPWWRSVPTRQCSDRRGWQVMFCAADGPGPGAYPVTVYYVDGQVPNRSATWASGRSPSFSPPA